MEDQDLSEVVLGDGRADIVLDLSRFDRSMLKSPMVLQACAVIVTASFVVFWPERSGRGLAFLIGLGLLFVSATSVFTFLRSGPRSWSRFLAASYGVAAGILLLSSPDRPYSSIGTILAEVIVITAIVRWRSDRRSYRTLRHRRWTMARTLAMVGAAVLLAFYPGDLVRTLATTVAVGWIAVSVLVLRISFDRHYEGAASYSDSGRLIIDWLEAQPKSVEDRQALYAKLLFDGQDGQRRIPRFFALMSLSAVIASTGVLTDSTAVVIGAMLVAPLMTPLMGMAVSLVMGWPRQLAHSAMMATGGIVVAIGIGYLIALAAPAVIDTSTNTQIISRATPTLLDLITATAAGAAGAYGLSRPDISDALPGVAIAISLVPPLSVVGIACSQGDWTAGTGALLLFGTNMLAILVVGGLTFVLTGVVAIQRLADNQHRVQTATASLFTVGALIVGFLMLNNTQVTEARFDETSVQQAIDAWVENQPQHAAIQVDIVGDTVSVTIVGPAENAPTAADLAERLGERLGRQTTANVRLIVAEQDTATSIGLG